MKSKSEVYDRFVEYVAMVTAKFGYKISHFRCDNGGEYSSDRFRSFCKKEGIQLDYTVARNPEQNGCAERMNRTLMNMARCLILDANMSKNMWGQAVLTAAYTINRLPTNALVDRQIPAELWYDRKISLENMRVFGCVSYAYVPKEDRYGKLDVRSRKMFMLGYTANGYRLWDPESRSIVKARNVMFDENKAKSVELEEVDEPNQPQEKEDAENPSAHVDENQGLQEDNETPVLRSSRNRRLPGHLQDYEVDLMAALSCGLLPTDLPQNFDEAWTDSGWKSAIKEEIKMLDKNETWSLVPTPKNVELVDSKWIFTQKESSGTTVKKARLVARGFMQSRSPEEDIYAPVARMTSLRVLLAIAVEEDAEIHQMDVKSAFLNGYLKTPVYMKMPQGVEAPDG
ncbi:unnamed protein product, partial [Nesidiocoris tenuis]